MDVNLPENLASNPLFPRDDFSASNVVNILRGREIGNCKRRHLKHIGELKTSVSKFQEVACDVNPAATTTYLMTFSRDCSKVASIHEDNNIYVFDVKSGKELNRLEGHATSPCCVSFHPKYNNLLASGCVAGEVRVWDLCGGCESWNAGDDIVISSVTFHPVDQLLVIAAGSCLYFWDWSQRAPILHCSTNSEIETVKYVAFDCFHRLITGVSNAYSMKKNFKCTKCRDLCPTNDDGASWHTILQRSRKKLMIPPVVVSKEKRVFFEADSEIDGNDIQTEGQNVHTAISMEIDENITNLHDLRVFLNYALSQHDNDAVHIMPYGSSEQFNNQRNYSATNSPTAASQSSYLPNNVPSSTHLFSAENSQLDDYVQSPADLFSAQRFQEVSGSRFHCSREADINQPHPQSCVQQEDSSSHTFDSLSFFPSENTFSEISNREHQSSYASLPSSHNLPATERSENLNHPFMDEQSSESGVVGLSSSGTIINEEASSTKISDDFSHSNMLESSSNRDIVSSTSPTGSLENTVIDVGKSSPPKQSIHSNVCESIQKVKKVDPSSAEISKNFNQSSIFKLNQDIDTADSSSCFASSAGASFANQSETLEQVEVISPFIVSLKNSAEVSSRSEHISVASPTCLSVSARMFVNSNIHGSNQVEIPDQQIPLKNEELLISERPSAHQSYQINEIEASSSLEILENFMNSRRSEENLPQTQMISSVLNHEAPTSEDERSVTPPLLMNSATASSPYSSSDEDDAETCGHRIQCWTLSQNAFPAIHNNTENLVVRNCLIHNDASIDISQDGTKLVALIVPGKKTLFPHHFMFGVFAMTQSHLGELLCTWGYMSSVTSVSFSPLNQFVLVGAAYTPFSVSQKATRAHIIKIDSVNSQYETTYVRKFTSSMDHISRFMHINSIKWFPECEYGFAYATGDGLTICTPVAGSILEEIQDTQQSGEGDANRCFNGMESDDYSQADVYRYFAVESD